MKRIDGFLVGMVAAVFLAWLWPAPGARGGVLQPELLNKLGVALIFFLHGLTLTPQALRAGSLQLRLHVLVQSSTFLLVPGVGLALVTVFGHVVPPDLRTGVFLLSALPSTVSSSVALTAMARGNVPAALFNATLSSLIGVFVTPLWLSLLGGVAGAGQRLPLGSVILDLVEWLILPLAMGQLLRARLGAWAARHRPFIHRVDRFTILLLTYTAFCDSFQAGIWEEHGAGSLLLAAALCAALLAVVMSATAWFALALKLPLEDRIVAVFCGSKKSLASGVPMARLIFAGDPGISVILLPLMIYHPLQLVVCGWFAGRWARRASAAL